MQGVGKLPLEVCVGQGGRKPFIYLQSLRPPPLLTLTTFEGGSQSSISRHTHGQATTKQATGWRGEGSGSAVLRGEINEQHGVKRREWREGKVKTCEIRGGMGGWMRVGSGSVPQRSNRRLLLLH